MGGEFSLDDAGLATWADIHSQVADGLAQLAGSGGLQAPDVATSFGNIAFAVNTALDGLRQNRTSTLQTTRGASDTIRELLVSADRMYAQGDEDGAAKLRAAAEALEDSGDAGVAGSGGTAGGGGGAGAGVTSGGGADTAGQMSSQVGQQVGQIAQGLAQSAQGSIQLPLQIMQGVLGMVASATKEVGSDTAKGEEDKPDDAEERKRKAAESDQKRAEDQREQQHPAPTPTAGQQAGADRGRAPVPPPAAERPPPAQTRPQQSSP